MCHCRDIDIGTYENQVTLEVPDSIEIKYNDPLGTTRTTVNVDRCLAEEIKYLWSLGIITTGCCCGHNKHQGYIGVKDEFIPVMLHIGYRVKYNECRPNDEDSFIPKSTEVF
jgi:hypothetical protein